MTGSARVRRAAVAVFWLLPGLLISGRLLANNINLGQWNLPVFGLSFCGLYAMHFRQCPRPPWGGAALLSLAAVLKYMPLGFAGYWVLLRRPRFAMLVLALAVVWAAVVPSLVVGPGRHLALVKSFSQRAKTRMVDMRANPLTYSHSVRTYIVRLLSPVALEVDGKPYLANIFNLEDRTAGRIADAVALAVLLGVAVLTFKIGLRLRAAPLIPPPLALPALWYCMLLMVSPGVRDAQQLTVLSPALAISAAALWGGRWLRAGERFYLWVVLGCAGLGFGLCSGLGRLLGDRDLAAEVYGLDTWAVALLAAACAWLCGRWLRAVPAAAPVLLENDVAAKVA